MDTEAPKKCHPCKKSRTGTQEKFARKFPYRFSWLAEPKLEPLQAWAVAKMNSSLREQLPLQKMLVPTRSIPTHTCPKLGCHSPGTQQLSDIEGPPGLAGLELPPTSQGPQPHKQGCTGMPGLRATSFLPGVPLVPYSVHYPGRSQGCTRSPEHHLKS
uniref:Uncharacterized protein n=1 Tax=Sus scrofa TaxID=9823 RepID=A0A8D0YJR0_PIG